jgi:hypothetical protein
MLLGAHQAEMIGAPALHEAQIIGVINDAGKIRVLVVDAELHVMAAVADLAVEGKVHCELSILCATKNGGGAVLARPAQCLPSLQVYGRLRARQTPLMPFV